MKRILVAWELGGNWGHLARDVPIALALRDRGYDVHFAVRDPQTAAQFLAPHGFTFEQAPVAPVRWASRFAVAENYGGVLSTQGYGDPAVLHDLVAGWLEVFHSSRPTLVIADSAPGARLAARVAGLPQAAVGIGFEVPPPTHPLPPIRPWEEFSVERMALVDTAVLEAFNTVLARFSAAPLSKLGELFAGKWTALTTFPELAHHGPRTDVNFVGPIYSAPPDAHEVHWPDIRGPRLLAYLRPTTRGLDAMLAALGSLGTVIACVPGLAATPAGANGACHIYTHGLHLQHLVPQADILVTNGSLTTSTLALLAGVPVLSVPNYVEQHLGALRIKELGAGLIADRRRSEREVSALLRQLLRGSYRDNARRFAQRYPNETVAKAVNRAVNLFEAAAR
jgi:UDP:flavonoid glycosyltransferase YjiC (YdhE family)